MYGNVIETAGGGCSPYKAPLCCYPNHLIYIIVYQTIATTRKVHWRDVRCDTPPPSLGLPLPKHGLYFTPDVIPDTEQPLGKEGQAV